MTIVLRIGLAALAVAALVIGAWNQFWPEHFYAEFPGVAATPPFAEHYARDFGGASLGLGIVLAIAAAAPTTLLATAALLGITAFALPHAIFHSLHTHGLTPDELVLTAVATWGEAVLALALLVLVAIRHRSQRRRKASTG